MSGDADRGGQSALDWLLDERQPTLLPTPWLTDRRFEDFVERLLKAQPQLGPDVRHVANVARWGVPGDKQDGIDLYGHYSDGVPAAWQCKHLRALTQAGVAKAVREMTFDGAKEVILVFADVAKAAARNEMRRHNRWQLWDRRDLADMLLALPTPTQRDILTEFWGEEVGRLLLPTLTDAFVSVDAFLTARRNPDLALNDLGPLAGRTAELAAVRSALRPGWSGSAQVTVISGPGGRGKSRLLAAVLEELSAAHPGVTVSCLAPGRVLDGTAMSELPLRASLVVVDDAHLDPTALEVGRAGGRRDRVLRLRRHADLGAGDPPPQGRPARVRRHHDLSGRRDHLRRRLRHHHLDHRQLLMPARRRRASVRGSSDQPVVWSRARLLAVLIGGLVVAGLLCLGMVLAVVDALRPTQHAPASSATGASPPSAGVVAGISGEAAAGVADDPDELAARPMPSAPESASHPMRVSLTDPGEPIALPAASRTGPAGVPTGFGHTPQGALAQLAAIDSAALGSASLPGVRAVIAGWAVPGGPTPTSWSGVRAVAGLLDATGTAGGSGQLAVVATPAMGLVKGTVGADYAVVCVDFEVDVTASSTARGALADCQRMVWTGGRWMIGAGPEPAEAPSVWPDTDLAYQVGYRDLRRG